MIPPRYEELRTALLGSMSDGLVRRRLGIILLLNVVTIAVLCAADFPPWRLALVAIFGGSSLLWQLVRFMRLRQGQRTEPSTIYVSLVINLLLQAGIIALTGGPFSPYIAFLFPIFVSVLITFGREPRSTWITRFVMVLPLAFAAMPAAWTHVSLPRGHFLGLAFASQIASIYLIHTHVLAVTDAYVRAGDTLGRMGKELLADVRERSKNLELVGAKMAHELKNPLAAVKGLTQLLDQAASDDRTRERLAVISAEASRMEEILQGYLSFSRPLEELRPQPIDLAVVADDALAVLEGRAQGAGVSVGREGSPVPLVGDARRLKEALLNVLANALEATPAGGRVTVLVRAWTRGGELVIRDTGKGIPPDLLARLGSPFLTTREGGTGLGVVLARAAVHQHGGEMHYASEIGSGTTVTIRLPAVRDRVPAPQWKSKRHEQRSGPFRPW